MIFISKENNGYFNKGEHYEVVPSPNQWNDNWLKVLDGNGKEIIDIQKKLLDFYFMPIDEYRDEQINKILDMYNGNIVLLGPPGSGKGTLAKSLVDKYGYSLISTGDILRDEKKSGSEIGKKINHLIGKGNLVPDELIFEIIENKLKTIDGQVIIDGTPRPLPQGEFIDKVVDVILVLFIDVSDETTKERIKQRGKTSGREDDQSPEIVERRLKQYKDETEPLVDFYKKKGILSYIDGEKSKEEVLKQVENILKLWK